ncbi:hypothetical protein [Planomonospora parontospora]|uniref:hypothetical protein n=1 Tax=Planomonospora parontospora TaxID=58119 RepID=UPI001670CF09|nr:hypothetical protein [Planomonospora parontospora]GGL30378.1 hypothetical protein GCM10014719_34650 [Planomonospora parontospora subsp. antibiotica]GII17715.1 hypothetical protein Ppa05_44410 [Planomonospora parontospora subsp. antibiotica]
MAVRITSSTARRPPPTEPALPQTRIPWTDQIEDSILHLQEQGRAKELDDGEESGDGYVSFVTGAEEDALPAVRSPAGQCTRARAAVATAAPPRGDRVIV